MEFAMTRTWIIVSDKHIFIRRGKYKTILIFYLKDKNFHQICQEQVLPAIKNGAR